MKDGEKWAVSFEGETIYLNDEIGVRYIAQLLRYSNRPIPAVQLRALVNAPVGSQEANVDILMELQNPDSELADPVFDERTVKQCEQRAAELREKIVVAGTRISSTELAEARLEIEEIEQYLRSSTGAWKRPRKFSTPEEKSRKSISITTRRTLHKIQLLHQPLADHLSKAIKFGRQIGYFPDREITWQL